MTRLLAIETSFETCSVALSLDGDICQAFYHQPRGHAELLLPAVEKLLGDSGLRLNNLDAIAFSRGPGSFTSLRLGIGVVQGIAWGAGLGVIPVSSLQATAQIAVEGIMADRDRDEMSAPFTINVAMDARMNEVFIGTYVLTPDGLVTTSGDPADQERVCSAVAAVTAFKGRKKVITAGESGCGSEIAAGNGFERFADLAQWAAAEKGAGRIIVSDVWPQASAVARLALAWLETHEPLEAHEAQPVYLRDNVAVKENSSTR